MRYGLQKAKVEEYLKNSTKDYLIIRLPKLYSENFNSKCFINKWIDELAHNKIIKVVSDQIFTPISIQFASLAIKELTCKNFSGIYHIGGSDKYNKKEIFKMIYDEYSTIRRPKAELVECLTVDLNLADARPLNTSLDSTKIYNTIKIKPLHMSEVIKNLVNFKIL
jgi:dTDP-4-dehydrorhamnose reductase